MSTEQQQACLNIINKVFTENQDKIAKGSKFNTMNLRDISNFETKDFILKYGQAFRFRVDNFSIKFYIVLDSKDNISWLTAQIPDFETEVNLEGKLGKSPESIKNVLKAYLGILETNGKAFLDAFWKAKKLIDTAI